MQARVFKYLNRVLIWSIPFYALNYLFPQPLFLNLPISFTMIIVPFALAGLAFFRESGLAGLQEWWAKSYDFHKLKGKYFIASLLILPVLFSLAYLLKYNFMAVNKIFANPNNSFLNVIITFILFYLGAIVEELGWTAYATPRLQESM